MEKIEVYTIKKEFLPIKSVKLSANEIAIPLIALGLLVLLFNTRLVEFGEA